VGKREPMALSGFHRLRQAKLGYDGLFLGSSNFLLAPAASKNSICSKVVISDSKIIILLQLPKFVTHFVENQKISWHIKNVANVKNAVDVPVQNY